MQKKKKEKKGHLIETDKENENNTLKSNAEIVEEVLELAKTCLDYQFLRIKDEKWKMQYKDDLYQDLILFLLEYDNEKLNNAYWNKHMNALITRIIQNQIYSTTSKFYHSYLRFRLQSNELKDVRYDEET